MKWLWVVLLVLLLVLQWRLWIGEGSLAELWQLRQKIEQQEQENAELNSRNEALEAEVKDLKKGLEAIEERARRELGMIKEDETFYQLIQPPIKQDSHEAD